VCCFLIGKKETDRRHHFFSHWKAYLPNPGKFLRTPSRKAEKMIHHWNSLAVSLKDINSYNMMDVLSTGSGERAAIQNVGKEFNLDPLNRPDPSKNKNMEIKFALSSFW